MKLYHLIWIFGIGFILLYFSYNDGYRAGVSDALHKKYKFQTIISTQIVPINQASYIYNGD